MAAAVIQIAPRIEKAKRDAKLVLENLALIARANASEALLTLPHASTQVTLEGGEEARAERGP
jgi:hypothetical protein